MIWTIARKEFFEKMLDFRVIVSFVIAIVLTATATYVAADSYRVKKAEYDQLLRNNQDELKEAKVYSQFKPVVCYPPSPLSIFSQGIDVPTPITVPIALDEVPQYRPTAAGANPIMSIFEKLDIAIVIRVLFSLLVILLTFDAFSGEKESGTLRQTLSNPVTRVALFAGKLAGTILVLAAVVALTFLTTLLVLRLSSEVSFGMSDMVRITGVALATMIYLAFFALLGMLISLLFQHSSTSLVVLLFSWFFLAVFQPNLNTYVVSEAGGTGWIQTAQAGMASADCGVYDELEKYEKDHGDPRSDRSKPMYFGGPGASKSQYYGTFSLYPEVTDADFGVLQYLIGQIQIYRKFGDCAERSFNAYRTYYRSHLERQLRFKRALDLFSPAALYSRSAAVLSMTDADNLESFLDAARQYRTAYVGFLDRKGLFSSNAQLYFSRLSRDQIDKTATDERMARYRQDPESVPYLSKAPPLDLSDAPVFAWRQTDPGDDVREGARTLFPLYALSMALCALIVWRLRSYDPR